MAMLCYKNGSLTRERIRDSAAGGSWDAFNRMLSAESKPGNGGNFGFYIDSPEITPSIPKAGIRRFNAAGKRVDAFAGPVDVRAVVEGQFLSMRVHGESVGLTNPKRLIATGGASSNPAIVQVISDIFGCPVFVAQQTDSASLGAAYRALHGYVCDEKKTFVPFETVQSQGAAGTSALKLAASPRSEAHATYTSLLSAYKAAEAQVLAE